ncbi:MAG TPA: HEAT repeat domain-containing protein, partial [Ktedonosporobacter sp.]|nr:HEAT repeat domain-containing protein [Ktedonosporobacter sp.]
MRPTSSHKSTSNHGAAKRINIFRQEGHADPCKNEELLHIALTEEDEDVAWSAVAELQRRGDDPVYRLACDLCTAEDVHARQIGANILGQLGWGARTFPKESVATLLMMLDWEQEPEVLSAVAIALGHRHDAQAIGPLARFKDHLHASVRLGVVHGLLGYEDELAIQTLIAFSLDPQAEIRDWATFGLGSTIETDTPAVRSALLARLGDEDEDTRGEAIVGLARRGDRRMIEPLIK